jgi:hypothetical protein
LQSEFAFSYAGIVEAADPLDFSIGHRIGLARQKRSGDTEKFIGQGA